MLTLISGVGNAHLAILSFAQYIEFSDYTHNLGASNYGSTLC